jgi:hypothetical protein
MKASELAKKVGLSQSQIAKRAVTIPGHRTTASGRHFFESCPALDYWIEEQQSPPLTPSQRVARCRQRRREQEEKQRLSAAGKPPAFTKEFIRSANRIRHWGLIIQSLRGRPRFDESWFQNHRTDFPAEMDEMTARFCTRVATTFTTNKIQSSVECSTYLEMPQRAQQEAKRRQLNFNCQLLPKADLTIAGLFRFRGQLHSTER